MQNKFTVAEIGALIAPRVYICAMGMEDELFDYKVTEEICEETRAYYSEFGADESLKTVIYPLNHVFDTEDTEIDLLLENL